MKVYVLMEYVIALNSDEIVGVFANRDALEYIKNELERVDRGSRFYYKEMNLIK